MPFRKSTDRAKSGDWKATLRAFVLLVAVVSVLGSAIAYSIVSRGLSAHDEPSRAEEVLARAMRRWATPESMRDRANPVQPTPQVINQALGSCQLLSLSRARLPISVQGVGGPRPHMRRLGQSESSCGEYRTARRASSWPRATAERDCAHPGM
jgi:hypothetical protein